jgi:CHAT domain-containing protein
VDNLPPLIGVRSTGIYHGIPLDALPLPVDEKPEQVTPATHDVTKRYSSQKKSSHENKIFTLSKTGRETQWAGEKMVSVLLTGPNSDLSIIEEPFAVKKAALFANPHFDGKEFKDLDGVRGEVDAVKEAVKKYPGVNLEVFFDSASNRENFLRMSGKNAPQVFHIATHGFSPRQDPSGSFLVLSAKNESGGRILQAIGYHDIMLMDLRQCDLVILSSCSTHEGQGILGEGIKGLAWAFKAAGAKAVIASRWEVRDQAAVAYWETFYKNLCKGLPIVDAFRQARRRLLKHDKWNHPHYWGVFQLIV